MTEPTHPNGPARGARYTDQEIDEAIGRLLQLGVLVAAVVVVVGAVALFIARGHLPADFASFRGEPASLNGVHRIIAAALRGDSAAIVQLGLVLLIATPIARVAVTIVAFWLQRDRLYVFISAIVLLVILFGLIATRT